jgi:SPP1 family predicted phage head-tail adaptor
MGYSTGMMNKRVVVAKRVNDEDASFGKSGQPKYEILGTFWMAETFTKGVKAMHEGALDAYDTVMFRCRYNANIDRRCLLKYRGKWYQITSFNEDYQDNQIQMMAVELANKNVNIVEPYSASSSHIGHEIHVGDI